MKQHIAAAVSGQKKSGKGTEPLGANSEIGRKLKQYYDGLVSTDVPDRFADLLKQLEASESDKSSTARDGE